MSKEERIETTMLTVSTEMLDLMMPMHVWFGTDGRVIRVGPTFAKLHGGSDLIGRPVADLVKLRRRGPEQSTDGFLSFAGQRLSLIIVTLPDLPMRGQCLALPDGAGGILNVSLGLSFAEAVEARSLTLSDFSPCDHTVDLLYLREAILSVAEESTRLTDRLVASEKAATMRASTDELTGLANRRALSAHLDQLVAAQDQRFAIMQIDLDHFKSINDEHGHHAGDLVLCRVAAVLKQVVRDGDVAARIGGDEFVLLIRGNDDFHVLDRIAERILVSLKEPIEVDGARFSIAASIGTTRSSLYARPETDRMLRDADEALYASKRRGRGRNCHFVPPGLEDRTLP